MLFACKPEEPVQAVKPPVKLGPATVTLKVLGEIQNVLEAPKNDDLKTYFEDLHVHSMKACAFSAPAQFSKTLWNKYPHGLAQLIAGCHTFFTMNDMDTHKSFERVKRLYPGSYNCHSVAFSQLYMMHDMMECATITAIDINWRILWGHYQFMKAFEAGKLELGKIRAEPGHKTGIWTFCYKPNWGICQESFEAAGAKIAMAEKINLQISFLHDMEFSNDKDNLLLFVSNAIDPGYTSKKQFDQLLDHLFSAIRPQQKAIVIYHAGGSSQYAVYELMVNPMNGVRKVKTTCRDDLVWAPYYSTRGQRFQTYFDQVSITKYPGICSIDMQD
jgi:hypothetical protein